MKRHCAVFAAAPRYENFFHRATLRFCVSDYSIAARESKAQKRFDHQKGF
jgi:hypothetical protein